MGYFKEKQIEEHDTAKEIEEMTRPITIQSKETIMTNETKQNIGIFACMAVSVLTHTLTCYIVIAVLVLGTIASGGLGLFPLFLALLWTVFRETIKGLITITIMTLTAMDQVKSEQKSNQGGHR